MPPSEDGALEEARSSLALTSTGAPGRYRPGSSTKASSLSESSFPRERGTHRVSGYPSSPNLKGHQ